MAYNDAKTCRQCGELIVFGQHTCPPRWTVILEHELDYLEDWDWNRADRDPYLLLQWSDEDDGAKAEWREVYALKPEDAAQKAVQLWLDGDWWDLSGTHYTAYVRPFDDARGQVLRCSVDIRKVLTYECSRAQTVRP